MTQKQNLCLEALFSVKNKCIVVTGGSRGIGKMIATGFVQNGATVYISSRKKETCEQTAQELSDLGPGKCFSIPADLSTEAACIELAHAIKKREKKVDVLVNNSGAAWGADIETYPDKAWDKLMALNLKAPFFLTRAFLPLLDEAAVASKDGGRVIMIGSIAGLFPQQFPTIAYDASKAALHHVTRVLAYNLARRPNKGFITVNCIAPGLVPSKMSNQLTQYINQNDFDDTIPLERRGLPSDMAGAAIFLASNASSWMTGVILPVDGGVTQAQPPALYSPPASL